jgi:hypothetical protein
MAFARVHVPALLLSLVLPAAALAQGQPATPPPTATAPAAPAVAPVPAATNAAPAPAPAPAPAAGTAPADGTVPADGAAATPPKPKVDATGYGYSDPKPTRGGGQPRARRVARVSGPVATLPGFEMTGDGGSRLFVQLTQSVSVEEKRAAGTVTYVLKGARVLKHNNQNALVTVHFNTPVSRARLVPQGNDLLFVVEMRSNVQATWKLEPAKDNSAVLAIDFPKGDFLPAGPAAPMPTDPNADPNATTTANTIDTHAAPARKPSAAGRVKRR